MNILNERYVTRRAGCVSVGRTTGLHGMYVAGFSFS